jgi:GPH family glycoside/pentoside/hexuronide:cation symporter
VVGGLLAGVTYAAYSAVSVAHQSWGAMLGGDALYRSRVVAWREGLGLVGVLLAAVTPALLGVPVMLALLWVGLLAGWLGMARMRPGRRHILLPHCLILRRASRAAGFA